MNQLHFSKSSVSILFWHVFILINCVTFSLSAQQNNAPIAHLGQMDLSSWDFEVDGKIPLNGSWRFYWNELYSPADYSLNRNNTNNYFTLPKVWNDHSFEGETLSSDGYATFQLQLTGDFKSKELALKIPDMYTSYNLWLNGKLIAANGAPGTSKESTIPQWIPFTKIFSVQKDTIDLILNISNFHHQKGGIKTAIWIGSAQQLTAKRSTDVSANLLQVVGLFILFILSFAAYFHYGRNNVFMFFSLFSLTWAIRGLFSNIYLINFWFPNFNWALSTKIEYLTLYFSLLLGVQIVGKMYIELANKLARYVSHIINSVFIIITLITPVSLFSQLLDTYFIFIALFMTYVIIVVINAFIHDKKGAGYLSFGIIFIILLFFYDLFSFQQLIPYNPYITSLGYLVIYYLNGLGIWHKVSHKDEPPVSSDYTYQ